MHLFNNEISVIKKNPVIHVSVSVQRYTTINGEYEEFYPENRIQRNHHSRSTR